MQRNVRNEEDSNNNANIPNTQIPPKGEKEKKAKKTFAIKPQHFQQPNGIRQLYELSALIPTDSKAQANIQSTMRAVTSTLKTWHHNFQPKYSFEFLFQRSQALGQQKLLGNYLSQVRRIHMGVQTWKNAQTNPTNEPVLQQIDENKMGGKTQQTGKPISTSTIKYQQSLNLLAQARSGLTRDHTQAYHQNDEQKQQQKPKPINRILIEDEEEEDEQNLMLLMKMQQKKQQKKKNQGQSLDKHGESQSQVQDYVPEGYQIQFDEEDI